MMKRANRSMSRRRPAHQRRVIQFLRFLALEGTLNTRVWRAKEQLGKLRQALPAHEFTIHRHDVVPAQIRFWQSALTVLSSFAIPCLSTHPTEILSHESAGLLGMIDLISRASGSAADRWKYAPIPTRMRARTGITTLIQQLKMLQVASQP